VSELRIFSGIQPTGRKHLGNYLGAIRQYVEGQDRGDAIYCIVDLHAITVEYEPAELRERVHDTTAILLAAGLDPERCILFRQSDVREHTELTWLLSAVTSHGDLNRMHQFKDKSARQRELVSAALFFYPVLMAADVLLYRATEVPVGDDQRQHVELMREIARRFNERFGELLVVPELVIPEVGARIMDLQEPERKMSTSNASEAGTVYVLDEPAAIRKKVGSAVTDSGRVFVLDDEKATRKKFGSSVTDSGREIVRGEDKAGITNLIGILSAVSGKTQDQIEADFADSGYGDFKKAVAEATLEFLAPVRERYTALRPDEAALESAHQEGAEKARAVAAPVLAEVRERMGIGPRR
jgi:tryptophanyl-tRNA synthetase